MELALELKFYFTELHVHGDERWPMEVTSNTYFRGVTKEALQAWLIIYSGLFPLQRLELQPTKGLAGWHVWRSDVPDDIVSNQDCS